MAQSQQVHRSTNLKQQNKRHNKLGHKSKGQVRALTQGRLSVQSISRKVKHELSRQERRNQVKVIRAEKKEKTLNKKRSLGTEAQPPFLVCVIVLGIDIDPRRIISQLMAADSEATSTVSQQGNTHISCSRFKQRYTFVVPPIDDLYAILDTAKVCSTLLVVWPCSDDRSDVLLGEEQQQLLSCIKAQGMPSPVHCTMGYHDMASKTSASTVTTTTSSSSQPADGLVPALRLSLNISSSAHLMEQQEKAEGAAPKISDKRRGACYQNLLMDVRHHFPGDDKARVHQLDKPGEALLCLRQVGAQKQRSLFYRDHRSHMIAEHINFKDDSDSALTGTLVVSGYLRGVPLSVNSLVHVPGWGDYQLSKAVLHTAAGDPHPLITGGIKKAGRGAMMEDQDEDGDVVVLKPDPSVQEKLETTCQNNCDDEDSGNSDSGKEDDGADFSDDEDLDASFGSSGDGDVCRSVASVRSLTTIPIKTDKIPGAYSSYQAAWMMDNDVYKEPDSDYDDDENEEEKDEFKPPPARADEESVCGADDDRMSVMSSGSECPINDDAYDEKIDYDDEMDEYERIRAYRDDLEFPDEIDTPRDVPARVRFFKYRGLESMRTSPWDLSENLPSDYRKIFQIPKFNQFRKRVIAMEQKKEEDGVMPGQYVTLHLACIEKHLYRDHVSTRSPLILFGLLPYEQKMSLVNVVVKSHPVGHTRPIKSKDRLIFHVGFRRFVNRPVFSEHTAGDKQKFCRFFHPGMTVVASMYAPVTYPPASVLVLRERSGGRQELVATGSVYTVDSDRCVLKRIILSGHPFKIHKRTVVVRYMFFNREDINWYKKIELRTKWGKKGNIKEPLGTHGHMKCQFNGSLKSQDTVLLNLYKRVFPKWTYEPCVPRSAPLYRGDTLNGADSDSDAEEEQEERDAKNVYEAAKAKLDRVLMPPPTKKQRNVHFS